jgi:hypothetical protein
MGEHQANASFGHFAHIVYSDEGSAFIAMHKSNSKWILDFGASKHVAGSIGEFKSYRPDTPMHQETIQTAQPIKGSGVVQYTRNIKLSSILYVPAFPMNFLSKCTG